MKHLFFINSHTTYLTSLGTISLLKLAPEDICMIYVRNYKNSFIKNQYKVLDLSWAYYLTFKDYLFPPFKLIRKIDGLVSELVEGCPYVFYAPNPGGLRLLQILSTNSSCKKINYVQEGALVFDQLLIEKQLPLKYRIWDAVLSVCFNHRIWASHYSWRMPSFLMKRMSTPECFCISEDIFNKLGYQIQIVKWPKADIEKTKYHINPDYPCFVLESSVEMGVVEKDVYFAGIKKMIKEKAEEHNYVKFHPNQSPDNINEILAIFSDNNCQVERLHDDFPFELYLSSYKHLKVYGFNSSLLVFAKQVGDTTYSLENFLLENSVRYREWRKKL